MLRIGKTIRTESRLVVDKGWGEGGKGGVTANGYRVSLGDDKENVQESVDCCTAL